MWLAAANCPPLLQKVPCISHQNIATSKLMPQFFLTNVPVLVRLLGPDISIDLLTSSTHRIALCSPPAHRGQTSFAYQPPQVLIYTTAYVNLYSDSYQVQRKSHFLQNEAKSRYFSLSACCALRKGNRHNHKKSSDVEIAKTSFLAVSALPELP